ncbi:hypothetical protein PFISCL1PPCAC_23536 [Pristionchus fissidentatus]|uniref:Uncharacterized protein n=1 Tax=Pristionchus fissidentatus TaxID=1538716 RepID=A0AAV5WKS3_9BILA|nr:hypothetical protein PFISCL1PPCAC_23536 [Pristionchus fissidentatus]
MGTEAKAYLQEHSIPQLFEGLMTGLIYNRPDNPIDFLEEALMRVREAPNEPFAWDMFLNKGDEPKQRNRRSVDKQNSVTSKRETPAPPKDRASTVERAPTVQRGPSVQRDESRQRNCSRDSPMVLRRQPSVIRAAEVAEIPDVPVVLFMGGPGGGKTKIAAKVYTSLAERYKDKYPEWREANEKYLRGELIPNNLALALVKAEMGRHRTASAFFLEVKTVNMALILDYDERTLREHMERRGLGMEIIDQIPGEKEEPFIFDRMKQLVVKAMEGGISAPPTSHHREHTSNGRVSGAAVAAAAAVSQDGGSRVSRQNTIQKSPSMDRVSKTPQQDRRSRTPRSRAEEEQENGEHNRGERGSNFP